MTTSNPYLTGDEDADLFEDQPSNDKRVVGFLNQNGSPIPKELEEALSQYIGEDLVLSSSTIPTIVSIMSEMQSFFSHVLHSSEDSPILLALYDVVNHMSEGVLDSYLAHYRFRQTIIFIHTIKFYSNMMLQMTESSKSEEEHAKIEFYLTNYNEYLDWKLEKIKSFYIKTCEDLGIEIDEDLLTRGKFEDNVSKTLYKASYSIGMLREKLFTETIQNDSDSQD